MSWLQQTLWLFKKDLLLEWRTLLRLQSLVMFSSLVLIEFSFALGPNIALLRQLSAGLLWLALLLSSVLALNSTFQQEYEHQALDALRLLPVGLESFFLSKACANACLLFLSACLLVPLGIVLYDAPYCMGITKILEVLLLGSLALSAPGTFYGAMLAKIKRREILLPLLFFPVIIPVLVSASKATALVMHGDPMQELELWLRLLYLFNGLYWPLCTLLFGKVLEA